MELSQTFSSISFALYIFGLCLILALLEIEIEGADGWAAALPTRRFNPQWLLRLTSGKAITGYHVWLNSLLIAFLHLAFWFTRWNPQGELMIVGTYFFMAVQWDFLWFVLNPHFGFSRFTKGNVSWFRNWFLGFPVDYYTGLLLSLSSWLAAAALEGTPLLERALRWWTCFLARLGLTIGVVLLTRMRRAR